MSNLGLKDEEGAWSRQSLGRRKEGKGGHHDLQSVVDYEVDTHPGIEA